MTLLEGFLDRMDARGVKVLLCGVRADFADKLRRVGLTRRLGERLFLEQPVRQTSTALAIKYAYTLIPARCAVCPVGGAAETERGFHYEI
jgi:hypothetical protein